MAVDVDCRGIDARKPSGHEMQINFIECLDIKVEIIRKDSIKGWFIINLITQKKCIMKATWSKNDDVKLIESLRYVNFRVFLTWFL